MKKIAFVIKLFQKHKFHGGGEKFFYNLIKRFSAQNYLIDIYCSESDTEIYEGINKIIVVNKPYNHLNPKTMEVFYNEVKTLVKDADYDFIISENITPPVDITVLHGHSLINRLKRDKNPLEAFFYKFRKVKTERIKFQQKWINQGYRHIFVVSEVLKKDIMDNYGISEDKISVVYPGVDISENADTPTMRQFNDNITTFGLSAPGFKIKGGFIFLKALGILKKKNCKFKARIIYPKYKNNLGVMLLIKLLGIEKNIEFLDYQKNIHDFYGSIDCLVAPSVEDTFNIAVLEAMANHKPCIVSTNAGACEIIRDTIINSEKNGYVFDMKNNPAKNLAKKMALFIENAEKNCIIAQNAFETAKFYNWDKTFECFCEKLKQFENS